MDYGVPDKRKSKKDLKKKRRQRAYKKGGKFRASNVKEGEKKR